MNKKTCPSCKSHITSKDGKRSDGKQRYKCHVCGLRFSSTITTPPEEQLWYDYLVGKQTISQLSQRYACSSSTIKRRLASLSIGWVQPTIFGGSGVVHIDATYFNRNRGVLVAFEAGSGAVLYMQHIAHECVQDYKRAIESIENRGYIVQGIVIDGIPSLFKAFSSYKIQMCQFHMVALIRRKLTKNPVLPAGKELLQLAYNLKHMSKEDFVDSFEQWKTRWNLFLNERSYNRVTKRTTYTHKRLRSAMLSIQFYIPWLFTFESVEGMPNTNCPIEGQFTDLKKKLAVHAGMSNTNRERFVNGFFLALATLHNTKRR